MNLRLLSAVTLSLSLLATPTAFAGSAGQKTSISPMCRSMVAAKHLKTQQEKMDEYNKCKGDPANYK